MNNYSFYDQLQTLEPKKDGNGNVVYQTAKGGEYKTDGDGNPIVKDLSDHSKPQAETVPYRFRMSGYPRGEAEPEDITRWQEPVGYFDYLRECCRRPVTGPCPMRTALPGSI